MIKVFTTNERGNIELPKDMLEQLLQEAYDEGRRMSGTCERPSVDEVTKQITINSNPHNNWTTTTQPLNVGDWKVTQKDAYELHFAANNMEEK